MYEKTEVKQDEIVLYMEWSYEIMEGGYDVIVLK